VAQRADLSDLLPLALARPQEALARAHDALRTGLRPSDASIARQVVGIVLRDRGEGAAAVRELRAALRLTAGVPEREVDVRATLGVTLVMAGRTVAGLQMLDAAVAAATGPNVGRVRYRRAYALWTVGHHEAALRDLDTTIAELRRRGDVLWEPRSLHTRAFAHLALGAAERAAADLRRAEDLLAAMHQDLESAYAVHNRGIVAGRLGDLPLALTLFDEAAQLYRKLDASVPDLGLDRCAVLLAAGLPADALAEVDETLARLPSTGSAKRPELLLASATSALACGRIAEARKRAEQATRLFGRQRRGWWGTHAALVGLRAEFTAAERDPTHPAPLPSRRLLTRAQQCAEALAALRSPEQGQAWLLVGQIATVVGADAGPALTIAAAFRRRGPALSRAVAWRAEALRAESNGDVGRVLIACRRGLTVIDEHRAVLGSSELRATASLHGAELARLALRHAARSSGPRRLLVWGERLRAGAVAVPPVRPPDDAAFRAELTAVREVARRLDRARADGLPVAELEREQLRRERAVRASANRASRPGRGPLRRDVDVGVLLDLLGDDRLLHVLDVDGALTVLVCGAGRVRRFDVGAVSAALREVEFAQHLLELVARRPAGPRAERALAQLAAGAAALSEVVLGAAAGQLGDGDVVVVPPGRLYGVPWALLPALRDRAVSVAPSARTWMQAKARPTSGGATVLVHGPGLAEAGREVAALRELLPGAVALTGERATAAAVLAALDGARLAHVAAHGSFRADSPLFSALQLADGPLTGYDLEGVGRAPEHLVLSACDAGRMAVAGADELIGLAASLIPLGTAAVVAALLPVNDAATARLMVALHRRLRAGDRPAQALAVARSEADSPAAVAAGLSFVCLGAS
jgi:tetratricopeptide (TPR) repeat protein